MKLRLTILSAAILSIGLCQAQTTPTVQWASKVLEVSSEYRDAANPGCWAAKEILGPPSVNANVPRSSECAWSPSVADNGREEYIKVGFAKPQRVQQIAISEPYAASAVVKVILFDTKGTPNAVFTSTAAPIPGGGRLNNIFIPLTEYNVNAAMIVLNTQAVPEFQQIDAIGISDGADSIKPLINLAPGILTEGARENLGENVNSIGDELLPIITPDGQSLYFTRQGHPENIGNAEMQDIWVSKRNPDGSWGLAMNMGQPLNNNDNNAASSISPDGQTLLLLNKYKPDGSTEVGVSMTRRTGDSWEKPVGQDIDNYYNRNTYGEYALASSGKTMILAIQRDDSRGSKDLYVSFRKENGSWTEPKSMGAAVNTAGGESTPFLASDDVTLYFSTNGRMGYGSKDMFVTRRQDSTWTNWSEPQNLGPVLNSVGWDAYYSIPASGDYAYFVSYQNAIGRADIFRAPLPESVRPKPVVLIKGRVLNAKTKEPLGADILYESLSTGMELGIARSNPKDGAYSIVLPAGELYGFLGQSVGYVPVSENIDATKLLKYEEITRDLYLVPIEAGNTVRLNNLFFDSGKWDLRPESFKELGRLIKLLKDNPTMTIEIAGHTDDVGTDENNLILSKKRATAVQTYLTEHSILPARLTAKGFGETKPQVPNANAENRQVNRRVEFSILQK
ncbi:MAG: OmpA family protein [Bacteroidia bacterium]